MLAAYHSPPLPGTACRSAVIRDETGEKASGSPEAKRKQTTALWFRCPDEYATVVGDRVLHAGGEFYQIQFLLGHVSIQTTEHYLWCKQKLRIAVNDKLGIEPYGIALPGELAFRQCSEVINGRPCIKVILMMHWLRSHAKGRFLLDPDTVATSG